MRSTAPQLLGSERLLRLREWSSKAGRNYIWRTSDDPWLVLVSEILLRRTKAEQVAALLPAALAEFPGPRALVSAPADRVFEVFRSAGLTSRVEQLREAAHAIVVSHGGVVPADQPDLLSLPGVGPYVAAIVSARISGSKVVVVDTNSVRVAVRVFGLKPTTKDPRRERSVVDAVGSLLGGPAIAKDWFAVIDLAHAVCRPTQPACADCPVELTCAYAAGVEDVAHTPVTLQAR